MTSPEDDIFPKGQPDQTPDEVVRIEDLESAQPLEAGRRIAVGPDFDPVITDLPLDGPSIRLEDGEIKIDKEALEAEMDSVTEWLHTGVSEGDEKVLEVYLRNLPGDDEETAALKQRLTAAFQNRDPDQLKLDELHVSMVSAGIAERNLIREGLRPELLRQPFYFRDKDGKILSGEDDLDIIFARGEGGSGDFKIIVGSKQGIDIIAIPKELTDDKFKPDLKKISKDEYRDIISVPLKKSADGTVPSAAFVEIHRGPIDLIDELARQDREDAAERAREEERRRQEEERRYSPPPPRPSPGSWSSHSG